MIKKPIKKVCPTCGKEHYDNRSCIKKEKEGNNLYKITKKQEYIGKY